VQQDRRTGPMEDDVILQRFLDAFHLLSVTISCARHGANCLVPPIHQKVGRSTTGSRHSSNREIHIWTKTHAAWLQSVRGVADCLVPLKEQLVHSKCRSQVVCPSQNESPIVRDRSRCAAWRTAWCR